MLNALTPNATRLRAPLRNSLCGLALVIGAVAPAAADTLGDGDVVGGAAPRDSLAALSTPGADPRSPQLADLALSVDAVGDHAFNRVRVVLDGLVFPDERDRLMSRVSTGLAARGVVMDETAEDVLTITRGGVGYAPERRYVFINGGGGDERGAEAIVSTEVPFGDRSPVATPYVLSGMAVAPDGAVLWQGTVRAPFIGGVDREVAAMAMVDPLIDALGRTVRGETASAPVTQPAAIAGEPAIVPVEPTAAQ